MMPVEIGGEGEAKGLVMKSSERPKERKTAEECQMTMSLA